MTKHRLSTLALLAIAGAGDVRANASQWELVRSVPYPTGETQDFVVVPENRQRDFEYYREISNTVCGSRTSCMVFFWTSRDNIPTSITFGAASMRTLTGQYERSPNYREPHLRLACWLYPSKEVGEKMNCFYMPGAPSPGK